MRIIGRVYGNMSLFDDAEALLEEALRIQRRQLAGTDLALASTMQDLAGVVLADGDLNRSRTYYEQSLDIRVHELGLDHADVAESMNYVANVLNLLGHPERAAEYWDDAYAVWERHGDFYNMAKVLSNRGWLHLTAGDPGPAVPLFDEALELIARSEQSDHPLIAVILDTRARAELALGNLGRARQDYERALGIRTTVYTEANQTVAHSLLRVAMIDLREGRGDDAAERYRRAREILEQTDSLDLPFIVYELASYAALAGDVEAALRDLRRAVVDHGIYATPRLLHDPNLDSLRSEPEFGEIVAEVRNRSPSP
jgi:tetratricopeptide (TPR) repeat protein